LIVIGAPFCLLTVAGFFGKHQWLLDLTAHFRVQYSIILALVAAPLGCLRRHKAALVFTVFLLPNLVLVLPYGFGRRTDSAPAGRTLRVLSLNVHTQNDRYDLVKAYVSGIDPDVILLAEVNARWLQGLADLRVAFPHVVQHPRDDNFGIALFSKLPFKAAQVVTAGEAAVPSLLAELDVGGRTFTVLGTHPLPPVGREYARLRNEQLAALPGLLAARSGPAVIVGDLNTTPWSYYFQRLLQDTGFGDSARGHGIQPTWPASVFWLRIPIDHCLVSRDLHVLNRQVGPFVGSDHLPLAVELRLPTQ
jgi:endonuclease/exonuclease/phosphatase (EEP) superfamily protein YafD